MEVFVYGFSFVHHSQAGLYSVILGWGPLFYPSKTVFILIKKKLLKIKSCGFQPNNARCEKMLLKKIVHLKEIYNFDFEHFLIKRTVFVLILKNVIKNQKFNFLDKLCDIKKNFKKQNCLFQKDVQILF